ncbi:hypothetical protein LCGC14_0908070 [marine sediment metagenome]|uniref:Uncharacterized protein n=1 Tax=marine sediment metagenome TaxID=412755 RepID=A0A0F9NUG0_9ZZZZ
MELIIMSENFEKDMRKIVKRIKERGIKNANKSKKTTKRNREENL